MIYGYPIEVYTDHKNLSFDKKMTNARVMQWRLLMEEYAPSIHYLEGKKNVVADSLSRLPFEQSSGDNNDMFCMVAEAFDMSNWRRFYQLMTIKETSRAQSKDKCLRQLQ